MLELLSFQPDFYSQRSKCVDNKPGSPGCALGVIREGATIYMRGYGLANLEHDIAIDPQRTVFDIGSTAKQFTAAAILLLVKDGKLSLDDDLRTRLPEMPDYGQKITLRDLLHQTSGLRNFTVLMTMGTGIREVDYRSADDAVALIIRQRALNFAPGSHFMYSNTNYFLLARIVERIGGKSFAQFVQKLPSAVALPASHGLGPVENDWEAAQVWLRAIASRGRRNSPETVATYGYHLAKLRWFCEEIHLVSPSRWKVQDVEAFFAFLLSLPENALCAQDPDTLRYARLGENGHTPFRTQPSKSSRSDIQRCIHAMFRAWREMATSISILWDFMGPGL